MGDRSLRHGLQIQEMLLRIGGLAVSLEPLGDDGAVRTETLALARRFEQVATLGERLLGLQPYVPGLGQFVAIVLELLECGLTGAKRLLGSRHCLFGDLQTAGILVTARPQGSDRVLESGLRPR